MDYNFILSSFSSSSILALLREVADLWRQKTRATVRPSGHFFLPTLLLSIFTLLFLPTSSVSLSYFIIVPIRTRFA